MATRKTAARNIEDVTSLPIGTPFGGGFLGGAIRVDGLPYALIVAPKALGQHTGGIAWNRSGKPVAGALSFCGGLTNTRAMSVAGSKLADWALGLNIGGFNDWYLPSQDELEVLYRNLKPTSVQNWAYARSGINLNAFDPTPPYTTDLPAQTAVETFRAGGSEAFDDEWYWSSTQHVADDAYAWCQHFSDGYQDLSHEDYELRARAVRRSPI